MSGNLVWVAEANSDARCMAMVVDFAKFGMDSAMLAKEMLSPEAFGNFREGILGEIPGARLISEKNTKLQGKTSFEYVIDMGRKDTSALNIMYSKSVFIGAKMYSISFYEKAAKPQKALRNKFFQSVRIN